MESGRPKSICICNDFNGSRHQCRKILNEEEEEDEDDDDDDNDNSDIDNGDGGDDKEAKEGGDNEE